VPWPFHLEPANALLTKVECFSAVSETELQVSFRYFIVELNALARQLRKLYEQAVSRHVITQGRSLIF